MGETKKEETTEVVEQVSKEDYENVKKELEEYKKAYEKTRAALNNAIRAYNVLFNSYVYEEKE